MPDIKYRDRRVAFRAAEPADADSPLTIEGYFVVFGQPYYVDDYCEEYVDRHAFDNCDMTDVRALLDHDSKFVLGRCNENMQTLTFSIDDVGLFGRIQINPDDIDALSARARVLRGDIDQASFGFEESDVEWIDLPDGRCRRIIKGISKLWEISVCTFAAYEQTFVAARSRQGDDLKRESVIHQKEKMKRSLKHHGKKSDSH